MKHLLKLGDLTPAEITEILDLADVLKAERKQGIKRPILAGKSLGMATAGLVCSIVALAIDIIIIATGAAILAELGVF